MVLTWLQFHLKSLCKIVDFEAFLIPPRGDPKMGEVVDIGGLVHDGWDQMFHYVSVRLELWNFFKIHVLPPVVVWNCWVSMRNRFLDDALFFQGVDAG